MTDKRIKLLAWRPKTVDRKLFTMAFPEKWRIGLAPLARGIGLEYYPTGELSALIGGWQKGVVRCKAVDASGCNPDWLTSLSPFDDADLEWLHCIFSIWTHVKFGLKKGKPVNQEAIARFLEKTCAEDLRCGIAEKGWSQDALPLLCANSLAGKSLSFAGTETGTLHACGTGRLVGELLDPESWSLGIDFSMTEIGGESLLACRFKTRRWIVSANGDKLKEFPLNERIHAHVRVSEGRYSIIPIGRRKSWERMHRECFRRKYPSMQLPEAMDVLLDPRAWLDGNPRILLPYKNGIYNLDSGDIGAGVSMKEKAELAERIGEIIKDCVEDGMPEMEHQSRKRNHHADLLDEAGCPERFADYVAGCSGRLNIEIWHGSQDGMLRDRLATRIGEIFGSDPRFPVIFRETGNLTDPVKIGHQNRIREICGAIGKPSAPTASLFVIPPKETYSRKKDPKSAIRKAFALSGRITQFITIVGKKLLDSLDSDKESTRKKAETELKETVKNVIWDILRQSGTACMPLEKGEGIPCVGARILKAGKKSFAVLVRHAPGSGHVSVRCNALETPGWQPYRNACLEMAMIECGGEREFLGPSLRDIINGLRAEYPNPDKPVLLVLERGNADRLLKEDISVIKNSGVRLIAVNRMIPDYLTPVGKDKKGGDRYPRWSGVWSLGPDLVVVENSGKMGPFHDRSFRSWTRAENPEEYFAHSLPVAYRALHLKEDDDRDGLVNFLNDTREFAIQHMDSPLMLPLVLHLAKRLEEYIIDFNENDDDD